MARSNLQIAVVKYTGDGASGRELDAGMVVQPVMALVQRDDSANAEASWRTDKMKDRVAYLGTTAGNLASQITQLDLPIILGSSANVNANTADYYALLIGARDGANVFTGRYRGAGAGNVQSGHFPFEPEIVLAHVTSNGVQSGVLRTAAMTSANSLLLSNNNQVSTMITALLEDGITVGAHDAVSNASYTYDYIAMRSLQGAIAYGSYVGNGVAQDVSVPGMDLSSGGAVLLKATNQTTPTHGVFATSDMMDDGLQGVRLSSSAYSTGVVTAMTAAGFSVGDSTHANEDARTYHFLAFKSGLFSVEPSRTAA